MIKIKPHLEAARLIYEILNDWRAGRPIAPGCCREVGETAEYRFILNRHAAVRERTRGEKLPYPPEEVSRVLWALVTGTTYTNSANPYFERLHGALQNAARDLLAFREKLEATAGIDFAGLSGRLDQVTPSWAPDLDLTVDVHLAPDLHRSAYFHEGAIGGNLLIVQVVDGRPVMVVELPPEYSGSDQPAPLILPLDETIAHETHHYLFSALEEQESQNEERTGTAGALLRTLASGVHGEGMATFFFSTPLANTSNYQYWQMTEARLGEHFRAFFDHLAGLAGAPERASSDEEFQRGFSLLFGPPPGGGTELCYVLGTNMCRAIEAALGRQELVELTARRRDFYEAYNQAAQRLNSGGSNKWPGEPGRGWPLVPDAVMNCL